MRGEVTQLRNQLKRVATEQKTTFNKERMLTKRLAEKQKEVDDLQQELQEKQCGLRKARTKMQAAQGQAGQAKAERTKMLDILLESGKGKLQFKKSKDKEEEEEEVELDEDDKSDPTDE